MVIIKRKEKKISTCLKKKIRNLNRKNLCLSYGDWKSRTVFKPKKLHVPMGLLLLLITKSGIFLILRSFIYFF